MSYKISIIKALKRLEEAKYYSILQWNRIYHRNSINLAIKLMLEIPLEEAIELVREKLPEYKYQPRNTEYTEKLVKSYKEGQISYQELRSLLRRHGIPEPYILLSELLLRDNGFKPIIY